MVRSWKTIDPGVKICFLLFEREWCCESRGGLELVNPPASASQELDLQACLPNTSNVGSSILLGFFNLPKYTEHQVL